MEVIKRNFSQGEWNACCLDDIPHFVFAGEKTICAMKINERGKRDFEPMEAIVTVEECVANAKLIQAAPEMFYALEAAVDLLIYLGQPKDGKVVNNALNAIKKVIE